MLSKIKIFLLSFLVFGSTVLALPSVSLAQSSGCTGDFQMVNGICVPKPKGTGLGASTNFVDLMKKVFTLLLGISGAISVLFVLFGGFQYMTSAGNEKQAETGKNNVMYAIIGLVVVILAYTIVNVVVRLVTK
jgi:hypothetical protein